MGLNYLVLTNYCKLRHCNNNSPTNKWGLLHFEYLKAPRCPSRLLCEHLKGKKILPYVTVHYIVLSSLLIIILCFPDKFCTACQMVNIEYGNVVLIFFRPRYFPENAKNCISGHLNFKHSWVSMTQTPYAKTRAMFYGNKLKCKARTFLGFLFLHFCIN